MSIAKGNKENIKALINRNDTALKRAVVVIFERQTLDEKQTESTRHSNNRGFNHADAKCGTYYARWILGGRQLTGLHLDKARRMMQKYCGQLAVIANDKLSAGKA
ncbi:MAG: hypothetical protein NUV49_00910 [Patescibacteria group bacterium]|nr:hypothetical protein [Patescibacteria group bacterium]